MFAPNVKKIITGYKPRIWQAKAHTLVKRQNVIVFHRQGGKTVFAVNHLINRAIKFNQHQNMFDIEGELLTNPRFAFVATTYGQVEKIAWQYFKNYMKDIPGVNFNEHKLRVTFPHPMGICTIYLYGVENFNNIRGDYLDGYVLDEFADMHPDVRDKVMLPMLSARKGWEMIIGTPKGENNFKKVYDIAQLHPEMWFSMLVKASESGAIAPEELEMLKISMSAEAYAQEYECDWSAAPSGKYYAKYTSDAMADGRVCNVPYDPVYPVVTYWDLGFSDSTAIWFIQEVGREIHVIDYHEEHGKGLEHYVRVIEERGQRGHLYHYAEHCLPHDADHTELSIGKSRVEFLIDHGLNNIRVMEKTLCVAEDVHAVRLLLPKCWFDRVKTNKGFLALASYERRYDAKREVYMETPVHNWSSHAADAFRGLAVDYRPGFGADRGDLFLSPQAEIEYNIHNF